MQPPPELKQHEIKNNFVFGYSLFHNKRYLDKVSVRA